MINQIIASFLINGFVIGLEMCTKLYFKFV